MSKSFKYNDYAEELANAILTAIPKRWEKPWEPGHTPDGFALPYNAISGKEYKGSNIVRLLAEQEINGYKDSRWLTFNQAKDLGGHIIKGQKGTTCIKWVFKEEEVEKDNGERETKTRGTAIPFTVFNAEQCGGLPLEPSEEKAPRPEAFRIEECEQVLSASGATVFNNTQDAAFYRPSTDSIHLPTKEAFKSPDHYYSTALHELSHWTGHSSRLNRDLSGKFGSVSYAKEELRAEIGSMLMGARLGIGRDPEHQENHKAYLKNWLEIAKNDPKEILAACRDVEKILEYLNVPERQHTPTTKAPALDKDLVKRGATIAQMHGVNIQHFALDTPEADALGDGFGYTGSTTFQYAGGGFKSLDECHQFIGQRFGTSIQYQIPKQVLIGSFDKSTNEFDQLQVQDIVDDRLIVGTSARNPTPNLYEVDELIAVENGQQFPMRSVIQNIELAQQLGIKTQRLESGQYALQGGDTHVLQREGHTTQLGALQHISEQVGQLSDRQIGTELRSRLLTAYAYGNDEAGQAYKKMIDGKGVAEFDAIRQLGEDLRENKGVATEQWNPKVYSIVKSVQRENGLQREQRGPALEL